MNAIKLNDQVGGRICGISLTNDLIYQEAIDNLSNIECALNTCIECPMLVNTLIDILDYIYYELGYQALEEFRNDLWYFMFKGESYSVSTYSEILEYIKTYTD